jgi:hypothetical protein
VLILVNLQGTSHNPEVHDYVMTGRLKGYLSLFPLSKVAARRRNIEDGSRKLLGNFTKRQDLVSSISAIKGLFSTLK